MTSEFWKNDPNENYRIFRDRRGRMVVKVVTPSGVVGLICADIPVTTIAALKHRIQCRILSRKLASAQEDATSDPDQDDQQS